jgi:MFS family permease
MAHRSTGSVPGDSKSPQGYSKRRFSARPPRGFFGINGFASLVASTYIGMFVGTLLFNSLSDLFGRRACGPHGNHCLSSMWKPFGSQISAFE